MSKSTSYIWISTDILLSKLHPENPRLHDPEEGGDVREIAQSLLTVGWATTLTIQADGFLLSGHGRVLAADFLRVQNQEWFDFAWEKWLKAGSRDAIAAEHKSRFNADYWENCPCTVLNLDEATQKSTMIRLNNTQKDGKDDPKRIAALLATMPKDRVEHSGWDKKSADAFIAAFVVKKEEQMNDKVESEDFQPKQYFERPDATDYSDSYDSGFTQNELSSSNYQIPEMAFVEEASEEIKVEGVFYDNNTAETRAVLLMSNDMLMRYKELAPQVAVRLGVSTTEESVKLWRPKAILAAMDYVVSTLAIPEGSSIPDSVPDPDEE